MSLISREDLLLLSQRTKDLYTKMVLLDKDFHDVASIAGTVESGSFTIDADSNIRRTMDITVCLDKQSEFTEKQYFTYYVQWYIGIYSLSTKRVVYYNMGIYNFDTKSLHYDATTNSLSVSLVDQMGMLDADHRGILYGAETTVIQALDDNGKRLRNNTPGSTVMGQTMIDIDGNLYKNTIRNALVAVLAQADLKKYLIEDIGAYSVVSASDEYAKVGTKYVDENQYNEYDSSTTYSIGNRFIYNNCLAEAITVISPGNPLVENVNFKYVAAKTIAAENFYQSSGIFTRIEITDADGNVIIQENDSHYEYNEVPYNLEFALGSSIQDEITTLRDLYLGYEAYFDRNGVFHCNMIPTGYQDPVILEADVFNKLVLSEDYSTNIYDVKNVIEVWGRQLDVDNYSNNPAHLRHDADAVLQEDRYIVTLDNFKSKTTAGNYAYQDGLVLGLKFDTQTGTAQNQYNQVKIQIVSDGITYPNGEVYDPETGNSQITPGMLEENMTYLFKWSASVNGWYYLGQYSVHAVAVLTNGSATVEQIAKQYNCSENAVHLEISENSPYTIENIGHVVGLRNDGDFANIESDILARSAAKEELWATARRTDTIGLTTVLIPFLEVNQKIEYTKQRETVPKQYIIKKISGTLDEGTMDVELMTFYPLYSYKN